MKKSTLFGTCFVLSILLIFPACRKKTPPDKPAPRKEVIKIKKKKELVSKEDLEKKQKHVDDAIKRVKNHSNSKGWTVAIILANYKKIAAKVSREKGLPLPSGYTWSGQCKKPKDCTVRLEFWDGRTRIVALWRAAKTIVPLNSWGKGLTPKQFAPRPRPMAKPRPRVIKKVATRRRRRRTRRRRRRTRRRRRRSRKRSTPVRSRKRYQITIQE